MKTKRISLRFNLDCDEDRRAWETLHHLDVQFINSEIIARINAKEQTDALKDLIQQAVAEGFAKASKNSFVSSLPQEENSAEEIAGVFDFLDSF